MKLTVSNLTKYYGAEKENRTAAVKDCSFTVPPGTIACIRGISGCGKTTLLRMLALQLVPDSGHVFYNDIDLWDLSEKMRAEYKCRHIGYIPQDFALIPILTVEENIGLPAMIAGISADAVRVSEWMAHLGLTSCRHQYPQELSGGQKQKCAIARAWMQDAELILADEPTCSLDDESTGAVLSMFRRFKEKGGSILMTTHDARLLACADVVYPMEQGKLSHTGM